ncbi:hypothetical protein EDD22DRAFT_422069 [Suillus occidentalis]|nr:hypothetical protein EDD22DRAFT_422069 [Suillus occidentalis]
MAMSCSQEWVRDLVFRVSQRTLTVPRPCPALSLCFVRDLVFRASQRTLTVPRPCPALSLCVTFSRLAGEIPGMSPQPGHVTRARDAYYGSSGIKIEYDSDQGDGTEDYSDDGTEDYSDDGTEDYSDDGTEDYSDDGTEDYSDDGTEGCSDDGMEEGSEDVPM